MKKEMPKSVPTVCANCIYWAPNNESAINGQAQEGMCFFNPPTVHVVNPDGEEPGAIYTRPVTAWRDFCGKFKVRVDA